MVDMENILRKSHAAATAVREAFNDTGASGEVVMAGDWHGQTGWGRHAIRLMARASDSPFLLHQGDFGFWPRNNGDRFLHNINKELVKQNRWIGVTPGNHEDYVRISRMTKLGTIDGVVWNPDYPRIVVFERGARWSWMGKTFLSVGGANSLDRQFRQPGKSWWVGEQITFDDVQRATEGGHADFMLTHEAPEGVDLGFDKSDGWPNPAREYTEESRAMMRRITDIVQPQVLFHGHYHKWMQVDNAFNAPFRGEYDIRTIGLDKDFTAKNLGVFRFSEDGPVSLERVPTPKPDWKFPRDGNVQWDDVALPPR